MPTCPQCKSPIGVQDMHCPTCGNTLKAFGHPGIELHQVTQGASLCPTCAYHADDTCTYPQRPNATACTLYRNLDRPLAGPLPVASSKLFSRTWLKRYSGLLLFMGLLIICFAIALTRG